MADLTDKYIRFDWAIKRLLRQKANFDVLEGFLTVFIGEPITTVGVIGCITIIFGLWLGDWLTRRQAMKLHR